MDEQQFLFQEELMFVVSVRERGKEEHKFTFRKSEVIIGRLRANDIILPKRNISKRHAKLELDAQGKILLKDMGSTNGSYVNGKKTLELTPVGAEDKIFMGDYILQVEVVEEKSAIESRPGVDVHDEAAPAMMPGTDEGDDGKATVAELSSTHLENELNKLGIQKFDLDGPETAIVNPDDVPSEAPPDLAMDLYGSPAPPPPEEELTEDGSLEEETLRMRQAASLEEVPEEEEELLEIPLFEEEAAAPAPDPAPTPDPAPAPDPAPTPDPAVQPLLDANLEAAFQEAETLPPQTALKKAEAATAQSVPAEAAAPPAPQPPAQPIAASADVATALDQSYAQITRKFDKWMASLAGSPNRTQVMDKVVTLLKEHLQSALPEDQVDSLASQVAAELGYLGAITSFIDRPDVWEVYVSSAGRIFAYDWVGRLLDSGASLSCSAATRRIAKPILEASSDAQERGYAQTRVHNGTLAKVLATPFAADVPSLRLVRPWAGTLSAERVQEAGVATVDQVSRLKQAIDSRRSILLISRRAPAPSMLLHCLTRMLPGQTRVLAAGERFPEGKALENLCVFDPRALGSPDFAEACGAMNFQWLAMENAVGDALCAAVELAGFLQVPFVLSTRLTAPGNISALGAAVDNETREWLYRLLVNSGTVVVTFTEGADSTELADGLHIFSVESGQPQLVPVAG